MRALLVAVAALSLSVPGSGVSSATLEHSFPSASGSTSVERKTHGSEKLLSFSTGMGRLSMMELANMQGMPGKSLSEKTLPLDRARANEMCTGEGHVTRGGPGLTFARPEHSKGLFYRTFGEGPRKVIMVMGLAASHKGWEYLLPLIVEPGGGTQVCCFDNRGLNGFVPESAACYSMDDFAGDVVRPDPGPVSAPAARLPRAAGRGHAQGA